jgi:hypothetical protein
VHRLEFGGVPKSCIFSIRSIMKNSIRPILKNKKNGRIPPPYTIIQIPLFLAHGSGFGWFLMSFGDQFSSNSMSWRNLLNRNTYNAKCVFLLLEASHFGIKNSYPN